ncbi:MAG TPA: hypothetical protein VFS08_10435 [Gemmatimonadaceae bacterium]|nr:hypothetical protein [Gemmatimonadaceae bacterium]
MSTIIPPVTVPRLSALPPAISDELAATLAALRADPLPGPAATAAACREALALAERSPVVARMREAVEVAQAWAARHPAPEVVAPPAVPRARRSRPVVHTTVHLHFHAPEDPTR